MCDNLNAEEKLDQMLAQISDMCRSHNLCIATCESVTSGNIAYAITSIPGSSAVFSGGLIAYQQETKVEQLELPEDFFEIYDVVSIPTAVTMAKKIQQRFHCDVTVATTGYAGPNDGEYNGYVCFAVACRENVDVYQECFPGGRDEVRRQATRFAIEKLYDVIQRSVS